MSRDTAPLGIVILCHTDFDRVAQVARFWLAARCPVVIHVDRSVPEAAVTDLRVAIGDTPLLRFSARHVCEWGSWAMVAATQDASAMLLDEFPWVGHVALTSGACLPLRPAQELIEWLRARGDTDFIESVSIRHADWTVGGLSEERFTLFFPFSWKKQRWLFDKTVELQRRVRICREVPRPLDPHMGSQWWCLSRATLEAILTDPKRPRFERYFKRAWIPDECYFQTLARLHSSRIESRSLTLVKFDRAGKPYLFYDDHLQLLRRSDCFMARKIWPRADALYDFFLSDKPARLDPVEPRPSRIDRHFQQAERQRLSGRAGLYMQSRFPKDSVNYPHTAAPYSVFSGFSALFSGFEPWVSQVVGTRAHGHLYAPEKVEFHGGAQVYHGAISNSAKLRDYNPAMFLSNLIWATRGERQCFSYSPRDNMGPDLNWFMASDPNAHISLIRGASLLPLCLGRYRVDDPLAHVAWLQKREQGFIDLLRSRWVRARVEIISLAEVIDAPDLALRRVFEPIAQQGALDAHGMPRICALDGLGAYLKGLRDMGLPPVLLKDYPY